VFQVAKRIARLAIPRTLGVWKLRRAAGKSVLLTFDDGPHPTTTPAVLDRLKAYNARAIFFVVGDRIHRAPEMLSRILREGHLVGNHTFTHPLDRAMGLSEYRQDLMRCQDEVFTRCQAKPSFHRPPLGHLSVASLLAPIQCGLKTLFWSCSSEDWRLRSDTEAKHRAEQLIQTIQPLDILLFHDESGHTLTALDQLLPRLKSRGLDLCPKWEYVR
jgi:peptidoglycan-N-acetylglucosamine deacetylase